MARHMLGMLILVNLLMVPPQPPIIVCSHPSTLYSLIKPAGAVARNTNLPHSHLGSPPGVKVGFSPPQP